MNDDTVNSLMPSHHQSASALGYGVASKLEDTVNHTAVDSTWFSIERICCDRHFGGMPIDDVVAIVRKHAPEFFI